jgi:hypothetical protein
MSEKRAKVKSGQGGTAGYSGTPLPKKLGIVEGSRVALIDAPDGVESILTPMPAGVVMQRGLKGRGEFDVIMLFVTSRAAVEKNYPKAVERLTTAGGLWISWPKKTSGVVTDVSENLLREVCLPSGLVDNKVCAVDQTWSGLRFVRRVKDR